MSFQALNSIGREPDVKLLYNVSFGAHEGSAPFARCRDIDEDIKADSKVIAAIASREDTYDNCGDDMDNILVSTRCILGEIILKIQSADPKQKLFGTFLINYKNN